MLDGIPILEFTPAALLGFAVLLLLTGRLVPRTHLTDVQKECERWRLAYEAEREAHATADAQSKELLEAGRTTKALLEGLFEVIEAGRESGDPDVHSKD